MECFNISNFKNFLRFLQIFWIFLNFHFFRHQGPRALLHGLKISFRIVSRVNKMIINCSSLSNFLMNFLSNFRKIIVFQVYEPVKLFKGILDNLLRQLNCFEDLYILNFSKILLKFAIVFKIFEYFCSILRLTIITGQRSFSSLADGLLDITTETKNSFEHYYRQIWKLFFLNFLQKSNQGCRVESS